MIDFLTNLFKSEDEKLAEQYEDYKKKYPERIIKQGNSYYWKSWHHIPQGKNNARKSVESITAINCDNLIEAKAFAVRMFKGFDDRRKCMVEV